VGDERAVREFRRFYAGYSGDSTALLPCATS
jgi:hypothetical protein